MSPLVLIVDDSLTVRMDLVEAFEEAGFEPRAAATLAEARQVVAREAVALVVLDVVLPDGDGVSLLEQLRGEPRTRGVPVLLLSTEADVKDRIRGLSSGADEYVGKPYDGEHVVSRARELLRWEPRVSGPAVLVVDDSATMREELRRVLEQAGYAVLTAGTGEDGLRLAARARPAALIVDSVLPGMDGATVIRRVRLDAALRTTPCLMITGDGGTEVELRALEAGADAFVEKQQEPGVLLARLAALVRNAEGGRDGATASLLGPKRILAVDDSPTYLSELGAALVGEGFDVVMARSGEEALELLSVQAVDCVLLDVVMPGIGGLETCRRIKDAPGLRGVAVVMLTGLEDRAAMIAGLGSGADDFVPKSADLEVLKARLRAQLRRRQFEEDIHRVRSELYRAELEATQAQAARALAEARAAMVEELERKNQELEAFSYSVSHDLRAPLRSVLGFSEALEEDAGEGLDALCRDHLRRVRAAALRMNALIDDLLELSRVGRTELRREAVDVSRLAHLVDAELRRAEPDRHVETIVAPGLRAAADPGLVRIVLENLLGNAWKFTRRAASPRIWVGRRALAAVDAAHVTFFVEDNGAGFDGHLASRLFTPFQRLHTAEAFPGTGIGLATVRRAIDRHGGRVWAESVPGEGTTLYFTLPRDDSDPEGRQP